MVSESFKQKVKDVLETEDLTEKIKKTMLLMMDIRTVFPAPEYTYYLQERTWYDFQHSFISLDE